MEKNPARVLHVIGAMDRGGAETLIMNVYRVIDRSKIQFDFLVHETRKCDYDYEINNLGGKIFNIIRFNGINGLSYLRECKRFFSDHHEYIAVHVHIGSSAAFVLRAAKDFGLYAIAHSHNTNPPISVIELGFRFFSFPTRFLADWYLACSEQAGIDRFGENVVHGSHFSILKNGIDVDQYRFDKSIRNRLRASIGLAPDASVVCHVGRFTFEKNHEFLIRVFAEFKKMNSSGVLLLVGRGPLMEQTRKYAVDLGIADSVLFLGVRDDVPHILMCADLFLFPSIYEGFGIAAIEAQATGLPCVLSDALPKIAIVSPQAKTMPLTSSALDWAVQVEKMLTKNVGLDRSPYNALVSDAGFDIRSSAHELINLYMGHGACYPS